VLQPQHWQTQVDVLFILDTSRSVYQYGYLKKSLQFVNNAVADEQVEIGPEGVHVALIAYADWATVTMQFADFLSKEELSKELAYPSRVRGCTNCTWENGNTDWIADVDPCSPADPTNPAYDPDAPPWLASTNGRCFRGSGLLVRGDCIMRC
jgi:hypothetical protein